MLKVLKRCGIGVGHVGTLLLFALGPRSHLVVYDIVVLVLELSAVDGGVEGILEVLGDFAFVKFLLNPVDDCHDSADVLIEHISLLQTLVCYNIVVFFFGRSREVLMQDDCVVCDVVDNVLPIGEV